MTDAVSGATALAGVIGDPVRHSLSPAIHNAAYHALGVDGVFVAFPVRAGAGALALAGARALGVRYLSVTTPHKDDVARAVDQATATVEKLGAANSVGFSTGVSVGYSTDGDGFVDDLRIEAAFDPDGQRCVVLGAGGAARAVILALAEAGASEVVVVNRTARRAQLAALLAGKVGRVGTIEETADAPLVVNATSLSLGDDAAAGAALATSLGVGQLAYDLVYAGTPFLTAATAHGASARDGLGMLVHQAAHQIAIHLGEPAPIAAMWGAVRPAS